MWLWERDGGESTLLSAVLVTGSSWGCQGSWRWGVGSEEDGGECVEGPEAEIKDGGEEERSHFNTLYPMHFSKCFTCMRELCFLIFFCRRRN